MKPLCLVIGAGAGIGGTVGKRFARAGYHAVLCRRSNAEGLEALVGDIGPIEVVVFNLGAQVGNRSLAETSLKTFELGWRMATLGLFRTASAVCPLMVERGKGTLLVTSATAAMRGNAG